MHHVPTSPLTALLAHGHTHDLGQSTVPPRGHEDVELDYPSLAGDPDLRAAVAVLHDVEPDDVVTTVGTSGAMFLVALAATGPGREAVVARPSFPPLRDVYDLLGVPTTEVHGRFDDGYALPTGQLLDTIGPRTGVVSVSSPQNPSGRFVPLDELRVVADCLAQVAPDAVLLVDEVYRRAPPAGASPLPTAAGLAPNVVVTDGLSKADGAPDLRVGWAVTTDSRVREALLQLKMLVHIASSALVERHALQVLADGMALRRTREHLAANAATVADWVADEGRATWLRPDAGGLSVLRLDVDDPAALALRLDGAGVRLTPGEAFGAEPGVFRLGHGRPSSDELAAGLAALSQAL